MRNSVFSNKILAAIDVGTTKICVLIANVLSKDSFEVIGIGKAPSHGLAKGVVVDIGKTVQSIKNAVREAELMAGCTIESAYIGISGAHIQSRSSQGMIPIKKREISAHDVQQVVNLAGAIEVPQGQQILHILPQYFIIDSKERILDPIGMYAMRLDAQVHIITGAVGSVHNLVNCCQQAGVQVTDIILEQLASGSAVLSDDERQLGVAMLDIGGGTSDLAIYHNNAVRHTMVLPVAGNHFTHDLAIGLKTTLKDAERVKKEYGIVGKNLTIHDQCIELEHMNGIDTQTVLQSEIQYILDARADEIFSLINADLIHYDMKPFIPAGLVLTGGGSLLAGIKDSALALLKMPIRIGIPHVDEHAMPLLRNPIYATAYGLLLQALKKQETGHMQSLSGPVLARIVGRMKSWVSDFF